MKVSSDGETSKNICLFSQQIDVEAKYIIFGEAMSIEANSEYVIRIQIRGVNASELVFFNCVSALLEESMIKIQPATITFLIRRISFEPLY